MSKNTLRWMTTRLPFITAVFVTLIILAGWLSRPIAAAPSAGPNAKFAAQSQVAGPGMYDDYDPVFRYSGHWQSGNYYPNAYNNTMHFTTDATARVALTFQGTGFTLYRVTFTNRGLMNVSIDGKLYQTVNNYSDQSLWQVPLTINGLPDGVHTVEFANTSANTYMDIDAVRVLQGNATLPPPTMTVHPVTATAAVPSTSTPLGTLPNLSVNPNQPLIPQVPNITTGLSAGIISPMPALKGLIYSGEESSSPTVNNLYTINPVFADATVQVSNTATAPGFNYPVWSPDGKSIAFADASGQLQILNVAAGTYSAPSTTAITTAGPVAWDPSGAKRIAYIDGSNYALNVVDFSSSPAVITSLITATSVGTSYSQVSWNHSANLITFQLATATTSIIESVNAACIASGVCTAVRTLDLITNTFISSDPAWSPDGTKLAYVSNRDGQTGGNNDVYVFDTATNASTLVSNGTSSKRSPTWSADGTQLVYVDNNNGSLHALVLVDRANTNTPATPLFFHTVAGTVSVSWSPLYTGPSTLTGRLTADNLTPSVGAAVTFTFSVTNTTSYTLTNILAQLTVNFGTVVPLSSSTGAPPTSIAPGATAVFNFVYTTTSSDACSLYPVAAFSGTPPPIGGVAQPPVTFATQQLTDTTGAAQTINVQRIGLTPYSSVMPSSANPAVGQTLTTTINVTNSGCLSEQISGNTTVNTVKTSDAVTSSGSASITLPPGNTALFTSSHTVTSSDFTTKRMVVAYTFNVAGSTVTGTDLAVTVVSAGTTYGSPIPTPTSLSTGIISPMPALKGLIYSGEESSSPTVNNLYTINPVFGDAAVQVSNTTTPSGFNYPVWSADGKSIAFADASGQLKVLNVATGSYRAPFTSAITITGPVAWDPSGANRIAYIDAVGTGNPLNVIDFSGTTPTITQVSTTGNGTSHSQISWLGGGIFYQWTSNSTTGISVVSFPCTWNCAPVSVINGGSHNGDPAWSPDGTKFAYVSNRDGQTGSNNDVYVSDYPGGNPIKVSSGTSSKRSPTWSADGTQLVYVDDSQNALVWVDRANTTTPASPPVSFHSAAGGTLSVSWFPVLTGGITPVPTYKGLIYSGEESSSSNASDLFTVNPIAGDTPVQVTNNLGAFYPVWSPDGKSVAFSDANQSLRILNVATGATSFLTRGIRAPIAWDPSGVRRIAYTDSLGGLQMLDFRGVNPIYNLIISTPGAVPSTMVSWNKNVNVITYQAFGPSTGTSLESVSASCTANCTPISALDPGANSAINSDPAWSPDGKKLAYVSNRDGQTGANNDIYVFDTATQQSTRITNVASFKNSPSWNYNGTQLVYVDSNTSIEMVDQANTTSPIAPVLIHSTTQGSLSSVSWSSLYTGPTTPTPSPTPIAITTGSLTADNLTPSVGAAVTFTFTVKNTTSYPLTSILAQLTVNSGTAVPLSSTTLATPAAMAPGTTAVFKFVYTTTATDACSLTPLASFSGTLPTGSSGAPTATFTTSQLTDATGATQTINVQRIGLTTAGVLPASASPVVGQTLTTTITVTNSGCLSELISGNTLVNNVKTSDAVTSAGSASISLPAANSAIFTSTHTVTSSDFSTSEVFPDNNGLAMVSWTRADRVDPNRVAAHPARATTGVVVAYTFTVTGSTVTGTPLSLTVTSSGTTYSSSTTTTPGAGTGTPTTLGLTKTASVSSIGPGGAFNYTITVTNNTGGTISALLISDSLPTNVTPGTVVVSPSSCPSAVANGSLTVTCSSLAAAQTVSVTIPVTVAKNVATGTSISNTANASYSGGNATPATVSVAVANGASSLPVTGYESDPTSPVMLIAVIVLIIGGAVVGARRYTAQQRPGASGQ